MAEDKSFNLHDVTTLNGYNLMECISAFQKCVRRSDPDGAVYWAAEAAKSGYIGFVWKRLFIILNEDVCPMNNPGLAADIWALFQSVEFYKKKGKTEIENLALTGAIIRLAMAKKSRVTVHQAITYFSMPKDGRPIPDSALDRHTARGRKLKRGWDHFFEEASLLQDSTPAGHVTVPPDPYERGVRIWLEAGEPGKQPDNWSPGQASQTGLFNK